MLASNAGCLLQIQREVRQRKLPLRVMHPMDLLDLSYRGEQPAMEPSNRENGRRMMSAEEAERREDLLG